MIRFCPKPHAFRPGGALSFETKDSPTPGAAVAQTQTQPGKVLMFPWTILFKFSDLPMDLGSHQAASSCVPLLPFFSYVPLPFSRLRR